MFIIILKPNTYSIISMSSAINSTEDILEKKFSTGYLLLPFLILLILNLKFIIGHFADNHIKNYNMKTIEMKDVPLNPNPHGVETRKFHETEHMQAVQVTLKPGEQLKKHTTA